MEEERKEKQKEARADSRFGLLELCLKQSLRNEETLRAILSQTARSAYFDGQDGKASADAIALIECLETLFEKELGQLDGYRKILMNVYKEIGKCVIQDYVAAPNRGREPPPVIPVMLKKIIQGWDAKHIKHSYDEKPGKSSEWRMHADAETCFLFILQYCYNYSYGIPAPAPSVETAQSSLLPLLAAINKEVIKIFKEHLEKDNGYWRNNPQALIEWITAPAIPKEFSVMFAKARIRFSDPKDIIAELKYLSGLGYYSASEEERELALRQAAEKRVAAFAERLERHIRAEWVPAVHASFNEANPDCNMSVSIQSKIFVTVMFRQIYIGIDGTMDMFQDEKALLTTQLHELIANQRQKIFKSAGEYGLATNVELKICWPDGSSVAQTL